MSHHHGNLLGEGATMIDLQVSGTFERNSPGKNRKFGGDRSLSSSAQSGDNSGTRKLGSMLEEQISDKKGFLLRKKLLMKKKAEFQKKRKLKGDSLGTNQHPADQSQLMIHSKMSAANM